MLTAAGRLKAGPERMLIDRYFERARGLARGLGVSDVAEREIDDRRGDALARLADTIHPDAVTVVFDERGAAWTSQSVAETLDAGRAEGRDVMFVIGPPNGLDERLRRAATHVVAFGAMTWPHELARVLAAEQIYRGLSLLANHPYHRA